MIYMIFHSIPGPCWTMTKAKKGEEKNAKKKTEKTLRDKKLTEWRESEGIDRV